MMSSKYDVFRGGAETGTRTFLPRGGRAQTLSPAPLHTSLRIDDEWLSDQAGRSTRWQHRAVGRGQKFVVPGNTFHFSFPASFIELLYLKN